MVYCAIANCKNGNSSHGIMFHRFPKNDDIRNKWMNACKRKDFFSVDKARICSFHFDENSYIRDLKAELLGTSSKKRLKMDAVPSLNLPLMSFNHDVISERTIRENTRKRKKMVEEILNENCESESISNKSIDLNNENSENLSLGNEIFLSEIECLNQKLKEATLEIVNLAESKEKLKEENEALIKEINTLKKLTERLKCEVKEQELQMVKKFLQKIFTPNQIERIIAGKKNIAWEAEDISKALVLRALSSKSYRYIREQLKIPLPCISTLKLWSRDFICSPGIIKHVICMMAELGKTMTDFQKLTVLSFDEMNIKSDYVYDHSEDCVLGPYNSVQVVLARGLTDSWKQPIFFNFNDKLSTETLFQIIKEIENIDFKIVSIVSDLGAGNQNLWKQLEISENKSYFDNPFDKNRYIWVFADIPHMIKLLRNHFLDEGFIVNNVEIKKEQVEKIIEIEHENEFKLCPKLSKKHIKVKGNERQIVSYATQLFSRHTACAIRRIYPQRKDIGDFFETVNDFYDLMNSRVPIHSKNPNCNAFGIHMEKQISILKEMKKIISNLIVKGKKKLLPFQRGILVSINSLENLLADLKIYNVKYIMTSRLNQDALENLFSQIRGLGRFYDHPLPTDFKNRLKILVLGSKLPLPAPKNVNFDECDHILTSSLFFKLADNLKCNNIDEGQNIEVNDLSSFVSENAEEEDAIQYFAGYLASRHKEQSLGTIKPINSEENNEWIKNISRGGLTTPNNKWLELIKDFESLFFSLHGPTLSKNKGIITNLRKCIENKFPDFDKNVIRTYSRTRTFFRIKYLNRIQQEQLTQKRLISHKNREEKKKKQWLESSRAQIN